MGSLDKSGRTGELCLLRRADETVLLENLQILLPRLNPNRILLRIAPNHPKAENAVPSVSKEKRQKDSRTPRPSVV
jgi:hypothetical protein